ncbi:MAG: wax ester/triacylglycerol synthase family O-acyltransferase [Acidimicrobiales bacterium]|nr:wax ester/triacylglycerol synthase family O-acyltransferase [Acidimicrobiales bacterium]
MTMERLSALDAEFLHLEDGAVHMHIAGACVFGDAPPTIGAIEALVSSKLHLLPRYRQRVRAVPFELGRPVWVDDPHFDIGYHLRHTALPAPGDDSAFCRLMGRIMSQPLDRERPLWEVWLVEGLEDGKWALIFKVHHCMVDGIAGVGLLSALLDFDACAAPGEPRPWAPRPEPPGALKVLDAWGGLVSELLATARDIPPSVAHPIATLRSTVSTAEGVVRFAKRLAPTKLLSIEGPIGPHRVWAHSSASLADVKTIRSAFGGTVNDVVLAAVAGGYRALLMARGDDADQAEVRSLVPVSTRHDDGKGVPDNRVSALLYELPVGMVDPVERLQAVRNQMTELKGSHIAEAGEMVTSLGDLVLPVLVGTVSRFTIRSMHRFGQRSLNTVTTNVPGPQVPLYCLGHEMSEYRPFVPISHGLRVGTAILSYNGRLFFGVTGDYESVPEVEVLATEAAATIESLFDRALERLR